MDDDIRQRLAWLEQKMVGIIWNIMRLAAACSAFFVAYISAEWFGLEKWIQGVIAVVTFFATMFFLQRSESRGAPRHIKHIDP
jgi:hypothetical protein